MDPKKLAQKLVQKNFLKFGSAVKSCTYKSIQLPAGYNVTTGIVAGLTTVDSAGVGIIFDEFSTTLTNYPVFRKDDSEVLSVDKVAIFPVLDLAIIPKVDDQILDDSNVKWRVKGISVDPFQAHYELHVRPF